MKKVFTKRAFLVLFALMTFGMLTMKVGYGETVFHSEKASSFDEAASVNEGLGLQSTSPINDVAFGTQPQVVTEEGDGEKGFLTRLMGRSVGTLKILYAVNPVAPTIPDYSQVYNFGDVYVGDVSATERVYTLKGEGLDPNRVFTLAELIPLMDSWSVQLLVDSTEEFKCFGLGQALLDAFRKPTKVTELPEMDAVADGHYTQFFGAIWIRASRMLFGKYGFDTYNSQDLANYWVRGSELNAGVVFKLRYKPQEVGVVDYADVIFKTPDDPSIDMHEYFHFLHPEIFDFLYSEYPAFETDPLIPGTMLQIRVTGEGRKPCISITFDETTLPQGITVTPEGYVDYGSTPLCSATLPVTFTLKAEYIEPGRNISFAELMPLLYDDYFTNYDDVYALTSGGDPFSSLDYISELYHPGVPMPNNPGVTDATYKSLFETMWPHAAVRLFGQTFYNDHSNAETYAHILREYYFTRDQLLNGVQIQIPYIPFRSACDTARMNLRNPEDASFFHNGTTFTPLFNDLRTIYDNYPAMCGASIKVTGCGMQPVIALGSEEGSYDFGDVCYGKQSTDTAWFTIYGENLLPDATFTYVELLPYMANSTNLEGNPFISNYIEKFLHESQPLTPTPEYNALFNHTTLQPLAFHNLGVNTVADLYKYYVTGQELMDSIKIWIVYTPHTVTGRDSATFLLQHNSAVDQAAAQFPKIYDKCYPLFDTLSFTVVGQGVQSAIVAIPSASTEANITANGGYFDFGNVCYGKFASDTARYTIKGDSCTVKTAGYYFAEWGPLMMNSSQNYVGEAFMSNYIDLFKKDTFMTPTLTAAEHALFRAAWPQAAVKLFGQSYYEAHQAAIPSNYNVLRYYFVTGEELLAGIPLKIWYTPSAINATDIAELVITDALKPTDPSVEEVYSNYPSIAVDVKVRGTGVQAAIVSIPDDSTAANIAANGGYFNFGQVCYGQLASDTARYTIKGDSCTVSTVGYYFAEWAPLMEAVDNYSGAGNPFVSNYIKLFRKDTLMTSSLTAAQHDLFKAVWPEVAPKLFGQSYYNAHSDVSNPANYDSLRYFYITGAELEAGILLEISYTPTSTVAHDSASLLISSDNIPTNPPIAEEIVALYNNYPTINVDVKVTGQGQASVISIVPADTVDFGNLCFGNPNPTPAQTFTIKADGCMGDRSFTFAEWVPLMEGSNVKKDGVDITTAPGEPFPSDYISKFYHSGVEFPEYAANRALYDAIFSGIWGTAGPMIFGSSYTSHTADELKYYYVTGAELRAGIEFQISFAGVDPGVYTGTMMLRNDAPSIATMPQAIQDFYHTNYPVFDSTCIVNVKGVREPIAHVDTTIYECYTNLPYTFGSLTITEEGQYTDTLKVGDCDVEYTADFFIDSMPVVDNIIGKSHVYNYDNVFYAVMNPKHVRYYVWDVPFGWFFVSNDTMTVPTVTLYATDLAESGYITVYGHSACGVDSASYWVDVINADDETLTIVPADCSVCEYYDFGSVYYQDTVGPATFVIKGRNIASDRKITYAELMPLMADESYMSYPSGDPFISNYVSKFYDPVTNPRPDMTVSSAYAKLFRAVWPYAAPRLGLDLGGDPMQLAHYYVTGAELNAGIPVEIYYHPTGVGICDTGKMVIEHPLDASWVYNFSMNNPDIYSIYEDYPHIYDAKIAVVGCGTDLRPMITVTPNDATEPYDFGGVYYGRTSEVRNYTIYGENLDPERYFSYAELAILMFDNSTETPGNSFINNYIDRFHHYMPMPVDDAYAALFSAAWAEAAPRLGLDPSGDPMQLANYYVTGAELMNGINVAIAYRPTSQNAVDSAVIYVENPQDAQLYVSNPSLRYIYRNYPEMQNFVISVKGHALPSYISVSPETTETQPYDFGAVHFGATSGEKTFTIYGVGLDHSRIFSYAELAVLMQNSTSTPGEPFISDYVEQFHHFEPMPINDTYTTLFNAAWTEAASKLGLDPSGDPMQLANYYVTGAELVNGVKVKIAYRPQTVDASDVARMVIEDPATVGSIPAGIASLYDNYPAIQNAEINVKGSASGSSITSFITVTPATSVAAPYDFGSVILGSTSAVKTFSIYAQGIDPHRIFSYAELAVLMQNSTSTPGEPFISNYVEKFYHATAMTVNATYATLFNAAWAEAAPKLGLDPSGDPMQLANYYVTGAELIAGIFVDIQYRPQTAGAVDVARMVIEDPTAVSIPSAITSIYTGYPTMMNAEINVKGAADTNITDNYITITPQTTATNAHDFGVVQLGNTSSAKIFTIYGHGIDPSRIFSYAELAVLMQNSVSTPGEPFISDYISKFYHSAAMPVNATYTTLFNAAWSEAAARLGLDPSGDPMQLANYYVTGAELISGIPVSIQYRPQVANAVDAARMIMQDPTAVTIPSAIQSLYNNYPTITNAEINVMGRESSTVATSYISVAPVTTVASPYDFGGVSVGAVSTPTNFTVYGVDLDPNKTFSYAELAVLMQNSTSTPGEPFVSNYVDAFYHYAPMSIGPAHVSLFNAAWTEAAARLGLDPSGNPMQLANYYVTGAELMEGITISVAYRPQNSNADDVARMVIEDPTTIAIPFTIASIYVDYPQVVNAEINVIGHANPSLISVTPTTTPATAHDFGGVHYGEVSEPTTFTIYGEGVDPNRIFSYAELAVLMQNSTSTPGDPFIANYAEQFFHFQPMAVNAAYTTLFNAAWTEAAPRLGLDPSGDPMQLAKYYVTGAELLNGIDIQVTYSPEHISAVDSARMIIVDPSAMTIPTEIQSIYVGFPTVQNLEINVKGHASQPVVSITPVQPFDFGAVCYGSVSQQTATYTVSAVGVNPEEIYSFTELGVLMQGVSYGDNSVFPSNIAEVFYHAAPMTLNADYESLFQSGLSIAQTFLPVTTWQELANYYVTGQELLDGVILNFNYTPSDRFSTDSMRIEVTNTIPSSLPGVYAANYPFFDNVVIELSGSGSSPSIQFYGDTVICKGSTTFLTAVDMNNNPFAWYRWNHSLENTSVISVSPEVTTTYYVEVINLNGCSTMDSITVTVLPSYHLEIAASICSGDNYTLNGFNLIRPISGVYTINPGAVNGCDSIIQLTLTVQSNSYYYTNATVCQSDLPYAWNGQLLTESGIYYDALPSVSGCDSTEVLFLSVTPSYNNYSEHHLCRGESFVACDNQVYTPTIDTVIICNYQSVAGCDSLVTAHLFVHQQLPPTIIYPELCEGELFNQYGFTLFANMEDVNIQPNIIADTLNLSTVYGCDSTVIMHLTVKQKPETTILPDVNICMGDSYIFNGQEITTTGIYTSVLQAANGCDSAVQVSVTVYPIPIVTIEAETPICSGSASVLTARPFTGPNSDYEYMWIKLNVGAPNDTLLPLDQPTVNTGVLVNNTNTPMEQVYIASVKHLVTGCVRETQVVVVVNPLPNNAQIHGPQEACQGEVVTLTASGAQTYTWNNGQTGETVSFIAENTTTIGMRATNIYGCSTPSGQWIEHTVNVNSAPAPQLQAEGLSNMIRLSWSNTNAQKYMLYRDNALIAVVPDQTIFEDNQVVQGYPYCYTVVASYGVCESVPSNMACARTTVGITEGDANSYTVYPNPASSIVKVTGDKIASVAIFNLLGQEIEQVVATDSQEVEFNVSQYESGVYMLRVKSISGEVTMKRMVVTH